MKNLKKAFALSAMFALVLAGCEQPSGDDPKQEEKTTITIRNECFSDLIDVKWSGMLFADKDNTLSISSAVTKQVEAGEAYIYFSRKSNPVVARTKELFTIEKGQQLTFRFFDNTLIVEASNPDNTGSLKDLISRLLTPSKPVLTAHNGTIEAVWEPVEGAASYRVYVSETETPPEEAHKTVTETAAAITGLTNEKTYYVWIQAVSARHESELSQAAHKTLTLGIPAAPALTPGNGSISASWETVDMATSYKVYIGTTSTPPEETDKTLTETNTVLTGLANDTLYYVWVRAVNAAGAGTMSEPAHITLTLAAPQNISLTAGNGSFTVNWEAIALANSYKVYYSTAATPPAEAAKVVTEPTTTISGLNNGTTYNVWVQAVNLGGLSALSLPVQKELVFAAPQNVSLTPGNGKITVQWDAVDGVSSYKVYYSATTTRPQEAAQTATGTSVTLEGLTNGTTYYVWVQAANTGGGGVLSERAQLALTLAAPQNVSLAPGSGKITVQWDTVNGASSYKVYYSVSTTPPAEAAQTVTGTSVTLEGLSNDTTYYVWVQAVNLGGGGVLSEQAQLALTLAAPQNVSLAPGSGKITVQWDAVTLADSYKVYYSTAATRPEEAAQNDLTGTSAVISGLSNDTPYHVWVQAVNLGGGGAVSGAAQISLTLEAPQTVTLSAGDGSLTASWGAVTLADSYKVYVSDTSVRPQEAAQTATGTSALVSGLSNNATYHVWVQAVNAGGESAFSEPAQVLLPVQFTVSNSAGLASAIASINAAGTGDYVITLAASITSGPITFTGNASKTITVMRNNASPSLVNGGGGALVTISGSITLILDKDITLDGNAQSYPVVNILSGGTFIMNNNSTVMGGRISGVGIRNASGVRSQGTFIMNGGTISGNSSTGYSTSAQARGGGVYIESGIFTMNGGTISGNSSAASSADYHARAYGGGVYIKSGIFTMSGGTISDNSCTSTATTWVGAYGGGVCIEEGTFMVSGGTISGNSSTARNNVYGGGVSIIHRRGIFTMRSGTISGNSSVYGGGVSFADGVFTKTGGTIDDTKWGVRGVQTPRRGVAGQGPAEGAAQDLPLCAKSFRSFACGKAGARGRLPPLFRLLPVSPVYS